MIWWLNKWWSLICKATFSFMVTVVIMAISVIVFSIVNTLIGL